MDEQIEILRGIWEEMKGMRGESNAGAERLRAEMDALRGDVKTGLDGLRGDFKTGLDDLRGDLTAGLGGLRGDFSAGLDGVRNEVRTGLVGVRGDLRAEIDVVQRRSVDRDMGLGTSLAELSRDVRELTAVVHEWRDEHRLDRAELHERVKRIERRLRIDPP